MQETLDDLLFIDIRHWAKRLHYDSFTARWRCMGECIAWAPVTTTPDCVYVGGCPIRVTYTLCHLGGQRAWFQCPTCNSRRALLYLDGGLPSCRACLGLPYAVTLETDLARTVRRQTKLNDKLCKKMRWQKRIRLGRQWDACEAVVQQRLMQINTQIAAVEKELTLMKLGKTG